MLHLLHDRWIPVLCRSGKECLIAPFEVGGIDGDEPVRVQGCRSDFQGSYIQFLIGLIQSTYPPEHDREWRRKFSSAPSPEELNQQFEKISPYFELFGDVLRFMQDPRIKDRDSVPIGRLLLEMPGENAEKNNTDHFLKRGTVSQICPLCAAIALFTLQTNASFGGAGHRVGLRGGGPMTTLVKGETLWQQIWLNVMDTGRFSPLGNVSLTEPKHVFPWSDEGLALTGTQVTPQDVHPNQMFWATPRRIYLQPEEEDGICDLCGSRSPVIIRSYCTEKGGVVYTGGWMHTLSPYYVDKKGGVPGAIHVQPGGISYRNWLGVIQTSTDKSGTTSPALVIQAFKGSRLNMLGLKSGNMVPLWAFGYDMDKAKARCYYESILPFHAIEEGDTLNFEMIVSQWIRAASYVLWALKQSVKQAWYETPKNHPGDISILDIRFWKETESSFYESMGVLASNPETLRDPLQVNTKWLKIVQDEAFMLFDEYSQYEQIGIADPKRIALARRSLMFLTHAGTKQVAEILCLPYSVEKKSRKGKKKKIVPGDI